MLRHSSAGRPRAFSRIGSSASIINAGDGAHEHPTQGLLDARLRFCEKRGQVEGLNIAIVGDILFSRVARSNIYALTKLGAKVTVVGPSTLVPRALKGWACVSFHKLDEVLESS